MALAVIGAGFGRTGTMSLKLALEKLGLGHCHHMEEVFKDPSQLPHWEAAARGEAVDWDNVFDGFECAVDWPSAHYWRDLAAYYPDAAIVLTVRPFENWWRSFSGTIAKILAQRQEISDPHIHKVAAMAGEIVENRTFGGRTNDEAIARAAFQGRIDEVKATIPAKRLLVFDVAEGWDPLCTFLGRARPDEDFPRSNSHDEFWQHFGPQN